MHVLYFQIILMSVTVSKKQSAHIEKKVNIQSIPWL